MRTYHFITTIVLFFFVFDLSGQTSRLSKIIMDDGNQKFEAQISMTSNIPNDGFEKDDLFFRTDGGVFFRLDDNKNGISGGKGFSILDRNSYHIFVVDEAKRRVGINTTTPNYTFQVNHAKRNSSSGKDQEGLSIRNSENRHDWTFYTNSRGNLNLYYEKNFKGYFSPSSGKYFQQSDARFKSNISYLGGEELSKIMALRPSSYFYNDVAKTEQQKTYGLIAQELQKVYPDMVQKIGDEEGYTDGRLTVSYTDLIPVLIAGMQEQQKQIAALQDEIADLKGIVETRSTRSKIEKIELKNAPNPGTAQTIITYELPHQVKTANIQIFDMNGRLLENFDLNNQTKGNLILELDDYSKGMYKYSLIADGTIVMTKSLIVQ